MCGSSPFSPSHVSWESLSPSLRFWPFGTGTNKEIALGDRSAALAKSDGRPRNYGNGGGSQLEKQPDCPRGRKVEYMAYVLLIQVNENIDVRRYQLENHSCLILCMQNTCCMTFQL